MYFSSLNNTGSNFYDGNEGRGKPLASRPGNYSVMTPMRSNFMGHSTSKMNSAYKSIDGNVRVHERF